MDSGGVQTMEAGFFQCPGQGDTVPVLELLVQLLYIGFLQLRCDLERVVGS